VPSRLLLERHGRVAVVKFSNPPRNFFDSRTAIELAAVVRRLDRDPSVGAVVLTGQDGFVTHYFVPELLRGSRTMRLELGYRQARMVGALLAGLDRVTPARLALSRDLFGDFVTLPRIYRTFARMNASEKVFIAAINGLALGMGAVLALACDLRLMTDDEDSAIGLIEPGVSVLAAAGGSQRLVRMVGQSRAAELLFEGRCLSPAEAVSYGIVHRAVPAAALQDEAVAWAGRLAGRSAPMNREIKRMLYDAGSKPLRRAMRMESASMVATMSTARASADIETYLARLSQHEVPSDADILAIWQEMLATGPTASGEPARSVR